MHKLNTAQQSTKANKYNAITHKLIFCIIIFYSSTTTLDQNETNAHTHTHTHKAIRLILLAGASHIFNAG